MKSVWQLLIAGLVVTSLSSPLSAQTLIFQEDFDQLPLGPPVDEDSSIPRAFTLMPPDNWRVDSNGVPGRNNPSVGVFEWEGWSFANKDFWIEVSNDQRRSEFKRAEGTIAVADPDEWNDLGNPANNVGFFNAFFETPVFNIETILKKGDRLQFQFDSSWRPQCCDDGETFDPNGNNKTATVQAKFEDGSIVELLRWESAPFLDSQGRPSTNPNDQPNPNFKSINTNELFYIDLSSLLNTGHLSFMLEFGLTNAGDDWWWAMDNIQAMAITTVPGDMDLSGTLNAMDIDDFAQAIHSTEAYRADHYDELPSLRGSVDSIFDFDDIDWFVGLLNGEGIAATRATILAAIEAQAIPEPSSGCLALISLGLGLARRRTVFEATCEKTG